LNTRVGVDIRLSELGEKYQAVFVAIGAHAGKTPGIENDGVRGVVKGIDFLKDVRLGKKIEPKEKVAIIGGGNVAIDCARTCVRLGFKEVTVLYRRSRAEMPALSGEVQEAEKECVKFLFLASPVKVLADDGVTGLKCLKMKLGKPDSSGRRQPLPVPGSEFDLAADLLILAVGETPELNLLEGEKTPLRVHEGLLAADPLTLQTNVARVFAGGDAVTGPLTVIEALAAGRKAAVSIDRFLRRQPLEPDRQGEGLQTSPLIVETSGVSRAPRIDVPLLPVNLRKGNLEEVELGYDKETASREAGRCLACGCQLCIKKLGCPAIVLEGEEVVIDSSQCPGCGICSQVCPAEAIVPRTV
jgi:NADPH-dependent glutamate synthase beta subunit-like oxidoreductase